MKKTLPDPDASAGAPPKPRLLFVGEGPQDIGRDDDPGGALAGFLHAALCGAGDPVEHRELPFEIGALQIWGRLQLAPAPGRRKSLDAVLQLAPDGRRARASLLIAATAGYDGVAVLRDCETVENIDLGTTLRQAREAYERLEPEPHRRPALVVAAASRCHETWLLADREAVRHVLGAEGEHHFSGDVEERPHCDELKRHLDAHAKRLRRSHREVRGALAFRARPAELSARCRRCYPPFLADVESELRARFSLPEAPAPRPRSSRRRRGT